MVLGFCMAAAGQEKPATTATVSPFNRNYQHDNQHKLRAGDKISFRIEEDRDEVKSLLVTDSGEVEVPYIGRVMAANKTCKALAEYLKAELEKEFYYQATVQIGLDAINKVRGQAYIWGQVAKTGSVPIPVDDKLTVSKAILQSGGFGAWADTKAVKIIRKSGTETKTFIVNVAAILGNGDFSKDLELEPEDMVIVPQKLINL